MAWEPHPGGMSREIVPSGYLVAFAAEDGWSVQEEDGQGNWRRAARGASDSLNEAMEQADEWAWGQGYRFERTEADR
jgi:hypothetical protein